MFLAEPLYNSVLHMKFRIIEKHDGKEYYYVIEQLWFLFWKKPDDYYLKGNYSSCKSAEDALYSYDMKINTCNVILERVIEKTFN